jgi:hypothetical protein
MSEKTPIHILVNLPAPEKYEDADPYFFGDDQKGFLLVADGVGGSGSTHHELPANEEAKAKFAALAYPGLEAELYQKYLDEIFANPQEGKVVRTSAFLGSRLVVPNLAFFLHSVAGIDSLTEEKRAEIVREILARMQAIADEFHLSAPSMGQRLLPTTLAGIYYERLPDAEDTTRSERDLNLEPDYKEGRLRVAALWAGDSRSYALANGANHEGDKLYLLSQDDEDEEGAITNSFTISPEVKTHLNQKECVIPFCKNILLFSCSDGGFDPFKELSENVAVVYNVIEAMYVSKNNYVLNKNLDPAKDWSAALAKLYQDSYQADDVSFALVALGQENFYRIRQSFADYREKIAKLFRTMVTDQDVIANFSPAERETIKDYIHARTQMRYASMMAPALAKAYLGGVKDFALTDTMKAILKKEAHAKAQAAPVIPTPIVEERAPVAEVVKEEAKVNLLKEYIRDQFLKNPRGVYDVATRMVKDSKRIVDEQSRAYAQKVCDLASQVVTKPTERTAYEESIAAFLDYLFEKESRLNDALSSMFLMRARNLAPSFVPPMKETPAPELKEATPKAVEAVPEAKPAEAPLEEAKPASPVEETKPVPPVTPVAPAVPEEPLPPKYDDVLAVLKAHQAEFIEEITQAYAAHPKETSFLDEGNFQPSRLALYREFAELDEAKFAEVDVLMKELEAFDKAVTLLPDGAKEA